MIEDIEKIIDIDCNICFESCPCQHFITLKLKDGTIKTTCMFSTTIYNICNKLNHPIPMHIHNNKGK